MALKCKRRVGKCSQSKKSNSPKLKLNGWLPIPDKEGNMPWERRRQPSQQPRKRIEQPPPGYQSPKVPPTEDPKRGIVIINPDGTQERGQKKYPVKN